MSFYRPTEETIKKTENNVKNIYSIVNQILFSDQRELIIADKTLKALNSYRSPGSDTIIEGLDKEDIKIALERLLGSLPTTFDHNNLLYKVLYSDVIDSSKEYSLKNVKIREQSLKEWLIAVLEMYKGFTPITGDFIDISLQFQIHTAGITSETSFSSNFIANLQKPM